MKKNVAVNPVRKAGLFNGVNKILLILIIVGAVGPNFAFSQAQIISLPGTLEEAKAIGEKALGYLTGVLKEIWQEGLKIWLKMGDWFKNIWNSYFWPKISPWFEEIKKELERRKIIIKEEFPREKEEVKEELPEASKSLWQRFKELIK